MNTRRKATLEDVKEIALRVLRREDVSDLLSQVVLTEAQRVLIRKANAEGAAKAKEGGWIREEYLFPRDARFIEGGAPGLRQQRR
ncbi:MAG: hypothetical protein ACKVVO_03260 [Opitutaceae bacterium]